MDNLIEAFGLQPNISSPKGIEEKSTIDKVFEEIEESESNKPEVLPETCITNSENIVSIDDLEIKSTLDTQNREVSNLRKTLDTKNNLRVGEVTNLMEHIDITTNDLGTKEAINLVDLLENEFNDKANVSETSKPNNLLDADPLEIDTDLKTTQQDDQKNLEFSPTENNSECLSVQDTVPQQQQSLTIDFQSSKEKQDSLLPHITAAETLETAFDLSKASNHFPESSLEYRDQRSCHSVAKDSPSKFYINHLPSLESEGTSDHFTPYDERLSSSQYHQNQDFPTGDFNSGQFPVDANDLFNKYKEMEAQQEMLNHSLISLSSHFAQVQLRLKQIINSPKSEQEELLRNLEKFTFIGIPEVNELCLYNYEQEDTESEKASKIYIEDKLAFEKNKHKEMIGKLRSQLEALENYVYEFSNNDSADIPTNQIISKQQIIINELKDKLNLNVNFSEESEIKEEINKSIINPMKSKEDLILQLKTQISDLEKFINFLQSTQCKCTSESGQVDMKNKTISIMKKISTILHIFAEHHSSGFKKPATVAAMKKSMKVNHYGDLRAQLEIAINHVMDACRQPPDQDVPIDSDYMSDTEDPVPCNSKVALAVRKQLSPTLQRLLQHGLSPLNTTQTVSVVQYISCASAGRRQHASAHIWDLIAKYYELKDGADFNCKPNRKLSESFNLEIGNGNLGIKQSLLASIGNILSIHHKYKKFNPDSYFKSFVCDGLNKKLLVEWLLLILTYKTLASEVYSPWSYVASTQFSDAAQSLRRLYEFHFSLTIVDVTIRNLQSIKDAF